MLRSNQQLFASAAAVACALAWSGLTAHADHNRDKRDGDGNRVRKLFVIAMENHNWTQPNTVSSPQQIK